MKSNYINFPDDLIELLHNPNIKNKCYMLRVNNYSNEKYEMTLSKENLKELADFINRFLEND